MREELKGLTDFERAVLRETAKIPKGKTRTYAEIARAIGMPNAARAVGNALAKNPLPVEIPCHRVVASSGLGGYSGKGGIAGKRRLLLAEGASLKRYK
ncbi:MAG: MGMT family protein [Candidatus Micrarchaeia archaeon]|jgi:O-6-methylguanine DNA methyltransferase